MDELLAVIGLVPLITCEEERLPLKAVKEKSADCDEVIQLEQANMVWSCNTSIEDCRLN